MRLLMICGVALIALGQPAGAGGDILRGSQDFELGPPAYFRWDGIYVGVQAGYASSGTDFGNATSSLIAHILRNTSVEDEFQVSKWTTLSKGDTTGGVFGGFVGYNFQWENAVIGIEGSYNRSSLVMAASDGLRRLVTTSDGTNHDVSVSGTASLKLTDYATVRGRLGWAFNQFMPYGALGIAIGRANISKSATLTDAYCIAATVALFPACPPPSDVIFGPITQSDNREGVFGYGVAAGFGVDYMLFSNLFLRAEYEIVYFPSYNDLKVQLNTVRAAVGVKF